MGKPSRVEQILKSMLGLAEEIPKPQSRVEELLIDLKQAIEGGGSGDLTEIVGRISTLENDVKGIKMVDAAQNEAIEDLDENTVGKSELMNQLDLSMKMLCPNNAVIYDDMNNPSAMVYIPAFKLSDVIDDVPTEFDGVHPAFIVNGREIPGFWYSKYQNCIVNNVPCSLPAEKPHTNISVDNAKMACENKGSNWHIDSVYEWAAIALWCKKNGFLPLGNNDHGKDRTEDIYKAIPITHVDGKIGIVATGTGPISWSHDNTLGGIWDMNGNVSDFIYGIRIVWGELQVFQNEKWNAINVYSGEFTDPECNQTDIIQRTTGDTIRLDYVNNIWTFTNHISNPDNASRWCLFSSVKCSEEVGEKAKILLKALALLPHGDNKYGETRMYWNNATSMRNVIRGGSYGSAPFSGIFYLHGGAASNNSGTETIGYRSVYIPE